jgi:hypothetical protein
MLMVTITKQNGACQAQVWYETPLTQQVAHLQRAALLKALQVKLVAAGAGAHGSPEAVHKLREEGSEDRGCE